MAREIKEFDLTREELVAALVEDSIGYLIPHSAELHIKRWEKRQRLLDLVEKISKLDSMGQLTVSML